MAGEPPGEIDGGSVAGTRTDDELDAPQAA
jgi:hypothetical protein